MVDYFRSQVLSGYNANPPSDDGTQTSQNQLQWSKHISKIGDPLKDHTEGVNGELASFTNPKFHLNGRRAYPIRSRWTISARPS